MTLLKSCPLKELKGFNKIHIDAGESKLVSFALNELDLAFFDPGQEKWVTEPGEFELQIGNSSQDIKVQKTIYLVEQLKGISNLKAV